MTFAVSGRLLGMLRCQVYGGANQTNDQSMTSPAPILLPKLLPSYPPKAGPLIVTIYGDIVEPRGGTLWMGDLITLCGQFGVNESLVRTAVSRLVARGQLEGARNGRRSYYRLTDAAGIEFQSASEQIFGPPDSDCDLLFIVQPDRTDHQGLADQGFGAVSETLFVGADRPSRITSGACFKACPDQRSEKEVAEMLNKVFGLDQLAARYRSFYKRIEALDCFGLSGLETVTIRLAMVHEFRAIRLKDPRLPPSVLPVDWDGLSARRLFAEKYLELSETADPFIGSSLTGQGGALEDKTGPILKRLSSLRSRG
ncbi:PaaX family transcriptional regulator C-terminal domain-containing protein [Roseibium alexandrii]|uniref:Phenylacetic acid-responsive transcriptional repressor n=1 Tax=Roseibium alexandrii (strain DSM 17067 / NCIMB 14079 / DFL-11) TaxID=244592 RepID=A0A5E8H5A6_ROSAD|nr:PaaX family transcriptional regulator C-terminal domain-containing protein [Roseibium alexandrii]EEE47170.2 Phenylacetic acid-responsive transcriptional repressor [Roseibium alexandrii DFL-11]